VSSNSAGGAPPPNCVQAEVGLRRCDTRAVESGSPERGFAPPVPASSGEHERHLAAGTVALQAAQVVAVLSMLAAITVLARRLSLAEFGTYGLLTSLASYVLFVQGSAQTAAIKAIAEAIDDEGRSRAFSTAFAFYALVGIAAGALVVGVGMLLVGLLNIPAALRHQAQLGVGALAVAVCIGWPIDLYQDALRATQRFMDAAISESVGYVALGTAMILLALMHAPLYALVGVGGSIPLARGVASGCLVAVRRLPFGYRRGFVSLDAIRSLLGVSSYLLVIGLSGVVSISLDRVILAGFRSLAAVGLYEGPIRAHNLVLQTSGTLAVPVLPVASRYLANGEPWRTRDLIVRGTRYTLAIIVPLTVVLMVLAKPVLRVWLGERYTAGATAMTLLLAYPLVTAHNGIARGMLIAAGRVRPFAAYAAVAALLNLGLSLALAPGLGLNGVVLGTTISYTVMYPFVIALLLRTFPLVRLRDLVREAWLPAYATGIVLAAALVSLRVLLSLRTLPQVAAVAVAGLVGYFLVYYVVWLRPNERALVGSLFRPVAGR
jgi:O-antigen/teichoic acid export membrane protein